MTRNSWKAASVARQGAEVTVIGMNEAGQTLIDRVGKHDKDHLPAGAAEN